ncbi:MAG: insulinase family protein [bacterium]|nr:insulinase family protein [bacterium]
MRDRFVTSGLAAALVASCVLVLVTAPAQAAPRRAQPQPAPLLPELPANTDILRLENGLPVVLLRNPGQPMVGIYTQVLVGSAREDFRTSGMSHMLEHLLFNGTEKYTQEELYQAADAVGAYNNANTTDFYTNYMMVVPAEHLEKGMDLQSQMLFHSLVPAEKFAKEQGIVVGEIVQGRDRPGEFAENTLREVIFAGSDLELPTVGTMATIEHMNRDDVYEFYRRWYVPNNMILTVAGNFDRAQVLEWLEKYYGGVPPGTLTRPDQRPARPIETTRGVTRRGGDSRALALVFTAPTWGQDDHTAFLVLNELLTLEGSGIITRALGAVDEAQRPEVSSWWEASPGYGRLVLRFELQEGTDAETLLPLVQRAVADAADGGIDETAIRGIARLNATQTLLNREQLRMTGIYIADALVQGGPDAFVGYLDRLNAVTAEDVSRVLDRWLAGAPCLAVLIEPAAPAAPATGGARGNARGAPAGMAPPRYAGSACRYAGADAGSSPGSAEGARSAGRPGSARGARGRAYGPADRRRRGQPDQSGQPAHGDPPDGARPLAAGPRTGRSRRRGPGAPASRRGFRRLQRRVPGGAPA